MAKYAIPASICNTASIVTPVGLLPLPALGLLACACVLPIPVLLSAIDINSPFRIEKQDLKIVLQFLYRTK
jgi:hypothetical protein